MTLNGVSQWFEQSRGFADPIGQRRAVKVDAFTLEDLRLAIERQMISVLIHKDMRQQSRSRPAFLDWARRHW